MTQKYLTAHKLGITAAEHAGLVQVMEHLRKPGLPHIDTDGHPYAQAETLNGILGFAMSVPTAKVDVPTAYNCGCVACIGGHLSLLLQGVDVLSNSAVALTAEQVEAADEYVERREFGGVLSPLFYPNEIDGAWNRIKPVTAADAIENFLTFGRADWKDACEKNGQSSLVG